MAYVPIRSLREEALRQLYVRIRNAALVADSFFQSGISPVIDDAVAYLERLREYVSLIRSKPLALVMLDPSVQVSRARDAARTEKHVGHIWWHLDGVMRNELLGTGLWIDNSALSPDSHALGPKRSDMRRSGEKPHARIPPLTPQSTGCRITTPKYRRDRECLAFLHLPVVGIAGRDEERNLSRIQLSLKVTVLDLSGFAGPSS